MNTKDYLSSENARNKKNALLYKRIIAKAFGASEDIQVGHHLSFQPHGDIEDLNEIPSADTLIFDHEIMFACFGSASIGVMQRLAAIPCDQRDAALAAELDRFEAVFMRRAGNPSLARV